MTVIDLLKYYRYGSDQYATKIVLSYDDDTPMSIGVRSYCLYLDEEKDRLVLFDYIGEEVDHFYTGNGVYSNGDPGLLFITIKHKASHTCNTTKHRDLDSNISWYKKIKIAINNWLNSK